MTSLMRRFAGDRSGAIIVLFGLTLLPAIAMIGAAVDYSRASNARTKLTAALDAATLALARRPVMPDGEARAFLESFVDAALDSHEITLTWAIQEFQQANNQIVVSATATLPSQIMGVLNIDYMDIGANTQVVREQKRVELSLALDVTGSMAGTKIAALRDSATDLVNIMYDTAVSQNDVRIALVPYVTAVNIKAPGVFSMDWIDTEGLSLYNGANIDPMPDTIIEVEEPEPEAGDCSGLKGKKKRDCENGQEDDEDDVADCSKLKGKKKRDCEDAQEQARDCSDLRGRERGECESGRSSALRWPSFAELAGGDDPVHLAATRQETIPGFATHNLALFDRIPGATWKGCVEARPAPYDARIDAPDQNTPDTLFVPYFWPDEPDSGGSYVNSYLVDTPIDANNPTVTERQRNPKKYESGSRGGQRSIVETPSQTYGPNMSCADPVEPLTSNRDLLLARIAGLRAWNNSGTNGAQGLFWAWNMVSPSEPFSQATPWGQRDVLKAVVMMTDGENQMHANYTNHNGSDYTSYGFLNEERLGTTNRGTANTRINERFSTMCAAMKAQGIRLYTITFQLNSASTQSVFRNCATEPRLYFNSPSSDALRAAFQEIAFDLSNLRISR